MKAGRELDALIAEKLWGKRVMDGNPCSHSGCLSHVSHPCDGCGRWHPGLIPHYSTRIADAWLVVEKLRADGFRWAIGSERNEWDIYLEDRKMGSGEGHAKTAPLAICLAALKAVEGK